jgi:hypothetical protein
MFRWLEPLRGKDESVHLERNNGRQRHWVASCRRRSIVVSRSGAMIDRRITLFAPCTPIAAQSLRCDGCLSLGNGGSGLLKIRHYVVKPSSERRRQFEAASKNDPHATCSTIIVLDAKYRIGEGLNDAISSAHMYRDALVSPVAGSGVSSILTATYLLSPDEPSQEPAWRAAKMLGRLFHPACQGMFRFGAVTLRPGMSMVEIGMALSTIMANATS